MRFSLKSRNKPERATTYIPAHSINHRALYLFSLLVIGAVLLLHFTGMQYTYSILTRISSQTAAELTAMNLPLDFLAVGVNVVDTLIILFAASVSLFIVLQRPRDRGALVAALNIILIIAFYTGSVVRHVDLMAIAIVLTSLAHALLILFMYYFPDGKPYPRYSRWIFPIFFVVVLGVWGQILPEYHAKQLDADHFSIAIPVWIIVGSFIPVGLSWLAQWQRYWRFATPEQRQQIKWVILGGIGGGLLAAVYGLFDYVLPVFETLGITPPAKLIILRTLRLLALCLFPLSILYSVLRRRLWDIDIAINRSLVYGGVFFGLVIIFVGLFLLLRAILALLLPNYGTEFVVVIPALLTGAAFFPVRQRVQHFVDRRLYGFRFDLNELARGQELPTIENPGAYSGRTLGGYQLFGVLGKGAMGEVYQGHNGTQAAAIKILNNLGVTDENAIRRFEREAEAITHLNHPGIVRLYASGKDGDLYFLIMEYVEGRTLRSILEERGKIPFAEIKPFLHDFAAALDYAHAQGFVHRDIKPANIMVRTDAEGDGLNTVLMDFGTAKLRGSGQTSITGSGAVGTIDYMAPEQIKQSSTVDHHADIYAFAVVLYETLTGRLPFEGTIVQILFGHVNQPPPNPRTFAPELPSAAADAIMRALSKDPKDRYATAEKMVTALLAK